MQSDETEFSKLQLRRMFPDGVPEPRPAADGRKLVEEAVAYARGLGFAPHRDYAKGARVFGGINVKDSTATYTFGKNGMPNYISEPYDNAEKIMAMLQSKCGLNGFHCLVAEPGFGEALGLDDEDDDGEVDWEVVDL